MIETKENKSGQFECELDKVIIKDMPLVLRVLASVMGKPVTVRDVRCTAETSYNIASDYLKKLVRAGLVDKIEDPESKNGGYRYTYTGQWQQIIDALPDNIRGATLRK